MIQLFFLEQSTIVVPSGTFVGRQGHTATYVDGNIFVIGGYYSSISTGSGISSVVYTLSYSSTSSSKTLLKFLFNFEQCLGVE